ncbi:MAG: acyltransferase family protein [Bdellovibrionota bacterium]
MFPLRNRAFAVALFGKVQCLGATAKKIESSSFSAEPGRHSQPALAYRPEIDGLRAVAVLSVMLYHARFNGFRGGFVGVDVFFVISGYLITSILLNEADNGKFSLLGFYERRVRRLFPALAVMLATSMGIGYFLLEPVRLTRFASSVVAVLGFGANFYYFRNHGYFEPDPDYFILLHTWSLGVEEQFYFFFPLLLVSLTSWKSLRRAVLLGVAVASFAFCVWASARQDYSAFNFYMLPTRAWEMLLGSFAVMAHSSSQNLRKNFPWLGKGLGLLGFAALLLSIAALNEEMPFPGWVALLPTFGTVLVLAFENSTTPVGRLLSLPLFVGLGLTSYSAYLWHQPVLLYARTFGGGVLSAWQYGGLILVSLLLGYLSWRFVENPIRNRKRFSRKFVFGSAFAVAVLLAGAALEIRYAGGFPKRIQGIQPLFDSAVSAVEMRKQCHLDDFTNTAFAGCKFHSERPTWAVFGDSHVAEAGEALANRLEGLNLGLWHTSFSGCGPRYLIVEDKCTAAFQRSLERLVKDPNVKNVLVGFRYARYWHNVPLDRSGDYYPNWEKREFRNLQKQNEDGMREIVERLQEAGKRVVLMYPVAEYPDSMKDALFSHRSSSNIESVTSIPREWVEARNERIRAFLDSFQSKAGVTKLDPLDVFCNSSACFRIQDGLSMYYDKSHLSPSGAAKLIGTLPDSMFR